MAAQLHVPGKALIKIDAGQGSGLEDLGYSIDGVSIDEDVFMTDVHSDQNGGRDGAPIDVQYFGEIARIRIEMVWFDSAVFNKLRARLNNGTAGAIGTIGSLMRGSTLTYRILISPVTASYARNYPLCIIRNAISYDVGSKAQRAIIDAEAHAFQESTLWNTTTS